MEAGRELDALIAEKVMGWKRMSWREYHELMKANGRYNGHDERSELTYSWHNQDGEMNDHHTEDCSDYGSSHDTTWSPSTNISAAWEVVEKIKFMQPNWQEYGLKPNHLQVFTVEYTGMGWRAGWAPISLDGVMTTEAEAEAAPHAICLAALKAVGTL